MQKKGKHLSRLFIVLCVSVFFTVSCQQGSAPQPKVNTPQEAPPLFDDHDADNAELTLDPEPTPIPIDATTAQTLTADGLESIEDIDAALALHASLGNGYITYINKKGDTYRIIRLDAVSSEISTIFETKREINSVAVSSSGKEFSLSMRESADTSSDFEIYYIDVKRLRFSQLTDDTIDQLDVSMSADANIIVWSQAHEGSEAIYFRDYRSGSLKTGLLTTSNKDRLFEPSVSSNGNFIAYLRENKQSHTRAVGGFDIQASKTVLYLGFYNPKLELTSPSITDEGALLVMLDQKTGPDRIFYWSPDYGGIHVLARDSAAALNHPHISADGKGLIFTETVGNQSIVRHKSLVTWELTTVAASDASSPNLASFWQVQGDRSSTPEPTPTPTTPVPTDPTPSNPDPGNPDPTDPSPTDPAPTTPTDPPNNSDTSNADYYVATNGSDSNSGRSSSSAFRTINRAIQAASAGDKILIAGGRYTEQVNISKSGNEANPIIIEGKSGEGIVIDRQGGGGNGVSISANWVVLRNVIVQNAGSRGIGMSGSSHIVIDGVITRNNGHVGIQDYRGNNNLIQNCVSHGNYDQSNRGGDADGVQALESNNTTIRNCVMYDNSDDGFDAWNSRNITIEDSVAYKNGYDRGDGNGFKLSPLGDGRTTIRRSIAYDNRLRGIDCNGGGGHTIQNNSTISNGWTGYADCTSGNYSIVNNISYNEERPRVPGNNNSWQIGIGNPQFKSTATNHADFLSLSAGSPAIDKGAKVTGIDYKGAAPDLGALEYGQKVADLLK